MPIPYAVILGGILSLAAPTVTAASLDNKVRGGDHHQADPVALSDADLEARLIAMGIAQDEVSQRLARLDANERAQLSQQLASMPAGGDSTITMSVGAAVIIALLLIIFL